MEWQALPQRRRKSRASSTAVEQVTAPTGSESSSAQKRGTVTANEEAKVDENIAARKKIKRAAATLEGKDGCAGEFYECKHSGAELIANLIQRSVYCDLLFIDLDHTADVQFHTWGPDLSSAIATMAPCMFNFITGETDNHWPTLIVKLEA